MDLQPGARIGPYEISGSLGAGGMGIVYAATDPRLGRRVAVKLLPPGAAADPERRRRFVQEGRAASALNHPNIAQIYDVVEEPPAIVMELVDGEPLDRVIAAGALPLGKVLDYAMQIASALEAAHAAGIVHRDIKPANIVVGRDGRVKVLDFGLAKLAGPAPEDTTVTSAATRLGTIMGTAAYMSPEQAQGLAVDARSDVFSFGAVLYEMLARRRPFGGDSQLAAITSLLTQPPAPLTGVPRGVAHIVDRALQKAPAARYADGRALHAALSAVAGKAEHAPAWRQPSVVAVMGLALIALLGYGGWQTVQARGVRWARLEAIPELERAQFTHHTMDAVRLARRAERYAPEEVGRVRQTWVRIRIDTKPDGALIEMKNYTDLAGAWEPFGTSPATIVIPQGYYRVRLTKRGYRPLEVGAMSRPQKFTLVSDDDSHAGMVPVPGGPLSYGIAAPVALLPYWIGRLEVTNRDYKQFVDAGGYRDPKFWVEPFRRGEIELPFAEAMTQFRDTTNRPGPARWELGTYPEGQADFPVGGISWFEAAAYARFAGKRLPSVYHWFAASGADEIYSDILAVSNFDGKGPVRAGEREGVGPYGTLDMAGNVKEWCTNVATGTSRRYILGGGWNEPSYQFSGTDAKDPWERAATFGVRLIDAAAVPPAADAAIGRIDPDPRTVTPASDTEFEYYKRFYTYDKAPLEARLSATDDSSPDWRKETVSYAAAYGGERIPAYVFAPKHGTPPFQAIVFVPTSFALLSRSSARLDLMMFDYLVKSGRAVIYPVYEGTFERRANVSSGVNGLRDRDVQWAKDVFRTIDYLESRPDIDKTRIGYYSVSLGAYFAPIPVALDSRFKAMALVAAGLLYNSPPEVQPANFMPRVKAPTLLLSGRDDFLATPEAQQRFLDLLGTPAADKKWVALDGGHVPDDWRQVVREVLDWFDKYLGPVR